jgi:hypothetical protein
MRRPATQLGAIAAAAAALIVARPALAEGGGTVHVVVEASEPGAVLLRQTPSQQRVDTAGGFQGNVGLAMENKQVCAAPCSADVPAGASYAVGGLGFRQSRPFVLTGENPTVKVSAQVGTENAFIGGIFLGVGGGLVGLVGLPLIPVGLIVDKPALSIVGGGLVVAGIAGVVTGIIMAAGSETKLTLTPSGTTAQNSIDRRRPRVQLTPYGLVF